MPEPVVTFAVGYYVVDEVGSAGAIAGPFATLPEAEKDMLEWSIAGDCGVWRRDTNGQMSPCPGYSLEVS